FVEVHVTVVVQGDRQGVVDVLGALGDVAAGDGPVFQKVGRPGGLCLWVELLQRGDERGEGVASECFGGGGEDRDHVLLAGPFVDPPGGVEAVDRSVGVLV